MNMTLKNAITAAMRLCSPVRLIVAVAVVGIFLFLVLGDKGIFQFRQLMDMKQRLMTERAKLNDDIDHLTREKAMLENPENLEPIIRTELGYIKPGEILFEEKKAESAQ